MFDLKPGPNDCAANRREPIVVAVEAIPLVKSAFESLVATLPGVRLADRAAGGPIAPSVVLEVDLGDSRGSGRPAMLAISRSSNVLRLAPTWEPGDAKGALLDGVLGCLSTSASLAELAAAIRQVALGEVTLPHDVARALIMGNAGGAPPERRMDSVLSPREREVLRLVCDGLGNKEIAQRLYLSLRTVENHLAAVYAKLGVASRTEAAVLAVRRGWFADMPDSMSTGPEQAKAQVPGDAAVAGR